MKPYAAVVRVSHMGERKAGAENVHTDRDQVEAIENATPKGASVEWLPPELDVSGGLPLAERPSLRVAVEGVESGRFAGIIVAYQSRLFRNVEEEEAVWRRVEAAGGEVLLALDGVDTKTVSGRMVRRIKSAINTAEREEHAERFERLREWATGAGIWQRRQTPRGYRRDETRHLVPDDEADAVREAFRSLLAGRPVIEIAEGLGMTPGGVRYLLRNRVYLGELRVGRHVNREAHPPLVDAQTFEAVQVKLGNNVRPGRGRNRDPALLAGLARCASCGHRMTRSQSGGDRTYACPRHHSGGRCPAPAAIMLGRLDTYVEEIALAELRLLEVQRSEGDKLARFQVAVSEAERELDAYLEAVSPQDVGADAFGKGARSRSAKLDEARHALRVEFARTPALPEMGTGAEVWERLDVQERNTLLRSLLEAVVVRPSNRKIVPVADRVRVLRFGTDLTVPARRGGEASGIVPIPFPNADAVGVLAVPAVED